MLVDTATTSGSMEPPSRILGMKSPAWGFYYSFFAKEKMYEGWLIKMAIRCFLDGLFFYVYGWTLRAFLKVFCGRFWMDYEKAFGWIMRRLLDGL